MHPSAQRIGKAFFQTYTLSTYRTCLDVGSQDICGTLRPDCPLAYTGLDIAPGKNVDIVAQPPWPLGDQSYDMIVSTSAFEHDPMFWITFAEMARVLKVGGVIYINAPSNGHVHRFPVDCWRFYPDAAYGMAKIHPEIHVIETFTAAPMDDIVWADWVAVFGRGAIQPPAKLLRDQFKHA